jgi:hypothetical protein
MQRNKIFQGINDETIQHKNLKINKNDNQIIRMDTKKILPTFDIKFLKDSKIVPLAKISLHFCSWRFR